MKTTTSLFNSNMLVILSLHQIFYCKLFWDPVIYYRLCSFMQLLPQLLLFLLVIIPFPLWQHAISDEVFIRVLFYVYFCKLLVSAVIFLKCC